MENTNVGSADILDIRVLISVHFLQSTPLTFKYFLPSIDWYFFVVVVELSVTHSLYRRQHKHLFPFVTGKMGSDITQHSLGAKSLLIQYSCRNGNLGDKSIPLQSQI